MSIEITFDELLNELSSYRRRPDKEIIAILEAVDSNWDVTGTIYKWVMNEYKDNHLMPPDLEEE